MEKVNYEVHEKEQIYFTIKVVFAIIGYALIFLVLKVLFSAPNIMAVVPLLFYIVLIILYLFFRMGLLVGYLKGNSIKVSPKQFPDIYTIAATHCRRLEMTSVPDIYILQNGGILNAFATRFIGRNYVVIYSDILEEAYENDKDSIEFIIGHELGHIKRKHITKSLLLFPSFILPFLNQAYSRACEYTCDNIGTALSPKGVQSGLLILASGKKIWKMVNTKAYIEQDANEYGFWSWLAEKVSTHPKLTRRLMRFQNIQAQQTSYTKQEPIKIEVKEIRSDHSNYIPK